MSLDEFKDELESIIDSALENMSEEERESLFDFCEVIVKERRNERNMIIREQLRIGEATILKALEEFGYSKEELKKLTIKFGDVGSVGEYVKKHKKQKSLEDYFRK